MEGNFETAKKEAAELTLGLTQLFDGKINAAIAAAVFVQLNSAREIYSMVLQLSGGFAGPELEALAEASAKACDCNDCRALKAQEAQAH